MARLLEWNVGMIHERNQALNEAINTGRALAVFEQIYHPDVTMQENDEQPTVGRPANLEREKQFFGSIAELRSGGVTRSAVDEENGISFAEMFFDCLMTDGSEFHLKEVAVRQWKDGKIIREQFFYGS